MNRILSTIGIGLAIALAAPAAHAGRLFTSSVSVLAGNTVQCAAANHREQVASVELTIFCNGVVFDGPTVRELQPHDEDVIFALNPASNSLCSCAVSFPGSAGRIRGVIQVFGAGNAVVERAEAR